MPKLFDYILFSNNFRRTYDFNFLFLGTHFEAFAALQPSPVNLQGEVYRRVKFDETVDKASSFNLSLFTAKQDGYFFFHFSAGYPWHLKFLSITLAMDDDINLFEFTTNASLVQFPYSASYITWLASNQTVCIMSKVDLYSDIFGQTLFLGFRLDKPVLNSFIALQLLMCYYNGFIHIAQNLSSTIHWDNQNNSVKFSFPTGGIYLTNLCIKFVGWGSVAKKQILSRNHNLTLFETYVSLKYNHNPVKRIFASYAQDRDEVSSVVTSVSRMISIKATDKMTMDYMLPNNAEISVQFILFSPIIAGQRVIWSLKYTQILPSKLNGFIADIIEGLFIKNNNELEIRQEGIYYVSLSAYVVFNHFIKMHVKKDHEYVVSFDLPNYRLPIVSRFTFHKANLAQLKVADKLSLNIHSVDLVEEEIYFTGFLLYPI